MSNTLGDANGGQEQEACHPRVTVLPERNHLLAAMTIMRDSNTTGLRFAEVVERVADQLIGAAIDIVPAENVNVKSPTNAVYCGIQQLREVCAVSILRAGASLENAVRRGYTGPLSFGKILIQRDEETSRPSLIYSKLPAKVESKMVLILEPMLATGGSACMAIDIVKQSGVPEENIIFVNVLSSRQGIKTVFGRHPSIHLVTAAIDEHLTIKNEINPGLGDFGDRFYNTND